MLDVGQNAGSVIVIGSPEPMILLERVQVSVREMIRTGELEWSTTLTGRKKLKPARPCQWVAVILGAIGHLALGEPVCRGLATLGQRHCVSSHATHGGPNAFSLCRGIAVGAAPKLSQHSWQKTLPRASPRKAALSLINGLTRCASARTTRISR